MKYTGRVMGTVLSIVGVMGWLLLFLKAWDGYLLRMAALFILLVVAFLGFWIGHHYDKVNFTSNMDFLTGIYNRRFIYTIFPAIKKIIDRNKQTLIVYIIDIDNFKAINDMYGHDIGDIALKKLSKLLQHNLRESDIVARWGGDEFVIITPNTDKDSAEKLISRIDEKVKGEFSDFPDHHFHVGISIGMAIYPDHGVDFDDLVNIADQNMYRVKQTK